MTILWGYIILGVLLFILKDGSTLVLEETVIFLILGWTLRAILLSQGIAVKIIYYVDKIFLYTLTAGLTITILLFLCFSVPDIIKKVRG